MSTEINTYELFELQNENAGTRRIADLLVEYLQHFNHMDGMEYLDIYMFDLVVDEKKVRLKDISTRKIKDDYIVPVDEDGATGVDSALETKTLWKEDGPMMKLVKSVPEGKRIRLEISSSIMSFFGALYGFSHFTDVIEPTANAEGVLDYLIYKCLEYYDVDPEVVLYGVGGHSDGLPQATSDLSIVDDITTWYSYNFECAIEGDGFIGEDGRSELEETIEQRFPSFLDASDFELDDDNRVFIAHSLTIPADLLSEFRNYLKCLCDFAETRDADIELGADFTPGSKDYAFACLSFSIEDGEVIVRAARL